MLRGLHKLCDKGQWDEVQEAIESKRFDPNEKGGFGEWTPLHLACRRDPPHDVIAELLVAAPAAASMEDINGRAPLHLAAERGDSTEVLSALATAHPPSVAVVDREGMTPLHLALAASNRESRQKRPQPTAEEVSTLLGSGAEASGANPASKADGRGNLPLHLLCDNIDDASVEALSLLVERYPPAVLAQNSDGHTPLHLAFLKAAEAPPSLEAVETLLPDEHASEICAAIDADGLMVLHAAIKNFASFEVLQTLLIHNPAAAAEPFSSGRSDDMVFAIDVLESQRPSVLNEEEMEDLNFKSDLLFAAHPQVMPYRLEAERMERMVELIQYEATEPEEEDDMEKKGLSDSAASVWAFLCTFPEDDDPKELYFQTVQTIVNALDSDTLRMLGNLPNSDGVPMRKCATPKVAALLNCTFRFVDRFEFDSYGQRPNEESIAIHSGKTSLLIKAWDYGCPHDESNDQNQRTRVVIKLESDANKFKKELDVQKLFPSSDPKNSGVFPILCTFDADRVGDSTETPGDAAYLRDMELAGQGKQEHLPRVLDGFEHRYATVMPMGDKNLSDMLAHEWKSNNVADRTGFLRECAEKMGRSVALLHSNKVAHCSLSLPSFVRLDDEFVLTDLEAAVSMKRRGFHPAACLETGTASALKSVSSLPPELFTELGSANVFSYCQYWSSVMKDAQVANTLRRSPDCDVGTMIKKFLATVDEWELVDALLDRFEVHSELWKKIVPRRTVGDDGEERFYVVKCARMDDTTGEPFASSLLPYELVPASEGHDVWGFGLLVFGMLTDRELIRSTGNGSLAHTEFLKLANWSTSNASDAVTGENFLSDPLARDLFRKLLVPAENRIPSIGEVLCHPYFSCVDAVQSLPVRNQIVKTEESKSEEEQRKNKRMAAWMASRTTEINQAPLSVELQHRFLNSVDAHWKVLCKGTAEISNPTGFTLLPYKLHETAGDVGCFVSAADEEMALALAFRFTDVLLYTSKVGQLQSVEPAVLKAKRGVGQELISEFFSKGREGYESKVIPICEWILNRARSAELIISELLDGVIDGASPLAKKLVHEVVDEKINLNWCGDIVAKAQEAEKAFAVLFGGFVQNSPQAARTAVTENLASMFSSEFCRQLFHDAPKVDAALSALLTAFVESPIVALNSVLKTKVDDLVGIYGSADKLYIYLLDEGNGSPILGSAMQADKKKSEALRNLFPALYLSMKSLFSVHSITGISGAFGLQQEKLDRKTWLKTILCSFGSAGAQSAPAEFDTFQQLIQGFYPLGAKMPNKVPAKVANVTLAYIQRFLEEKDPRRRFGGLRRLKCVDGSAMWVSKAQEKELVGEAVSAVAEFARLKQIEIASLLGDEKAMKEVSSGSTLLTPHRTSTGVTSSPKTMRTVDMADTETVTTLGSAMTLNSDAITVIQSFEGLDPAGQFNPFPVLPSSQNKQPDPVELTRSPMPNRIAVSPNRAQRSRRKALWK